MNADAVPYVRTIVLPPRQLTDWEVEALRDAMNAKQSAAYAAGMRSSGGIFSFLAHPAASHCPCACQCNCLLGRMF